MSFSWPSISKHHPTKIICGFFFSPLLSFLLPVPSKHTLDWIKTLHSFRSLSGHHPQPVRHGLHRQDPGGGAVLLPARPQLPAQRPAGGPPARHARLRLAGRLQPHRPRHSHAQPVRRRKSFCAAQIPLTGILTRRIKLTEEEGRARRIPQNFSKPLGGGGPRNVVFHVTLRGQVLGRFYSLANPIKRRS